MKQFNIRSYSIGVATGMAVLALLFGANRFFGTASEASSQPGRALLNQSRGQFGSDAARFPADGMLDENRLQAMAERFGMSVGELQAELDAGKALPEIAEERGVNFPAGMRQGRANAPLAGTGTVFTDDAFEASADTLRQELPDATSEN